MSKNIDTLKKISFSCDSNHKNYDLFHKYDNIMTSYFGNIHYLRIEERKNPIVIGDYSYYDINLDIARTVGGKNYFDKFFGEHNNFFEYSITSDLILSNFRHWEYDRIILIDYLILHGLYRKQGIFFEFIEMLYRKHYNNGVAIVGLFKPLEHYDKNGYLIGYFKNEKFGNNKKNKTIYEHYGLDSLSVLDYESSLFKLYNLAQKNGFDKLVNSDFFILNDEKFKKMLELKWR